MFIYTPVLRKLQDFKAYFYMTGDFIEACYYSPA